MTDADSITLTASEREILDLAATGMSDDRIAHELGVPSSSIRAAWASVRRKLGAKNRTHAVALACRNVEIRGPSEDPLARAAASLDAWRLAWWVFLSQSDEALLDPAGERLFALPSSGGAPVPLDVLLGRLWHPDRTRFERYLRRGADLRPMTPIDFRTGEPGDYRNCMRTVNLATEVGKGAATLLASTLV